MHLVEAMFEAKNQLAAELNATIPGTDLIEVYAQALAGNIESMSVEEVKDLVLIVARQRLESL